MLELKLSPFPELKTTRMVLRSIDQSDARELFLLRTNEQVLKYLDRAPLASEKEAGEFINKILTQQKNNDGILWVMAYKDEPHKLIGTIGFWKINAEHYRAESVICYLQITGRKAL